MDTATTSKVLDTLRWAYVTINDIAKGDASYHAKTYSTVVEIRNSICAITGITAEEFQQRFANVSRNDNSWNLFITLQPLHKSDSMSRRDYFAAHAPAVPEWFKPKIETNRKSLTLATWAYRYADAMLEASNIENP